MGSIEDEVHAAVEILRALGYSKGGVRIVSCPRCGRHTFDSQGFLTQVENRLLTVNKDITVAIMGCQVNGPGEARNADVAITGIGNKVFLYCAAASFTRMLMSCPQRTVFSILLMKSECNE